MNCPNCNKERDFSENQCECGFVFAPGCLMPVILFSALHVAAAYSLIMAPEEMAFMFSREVGIAATALFVVLTAGLVRRKVWAIYGLRTSFILLIVLQIYVAYHGQAGLEARHVVFPALHALVAVYLSKSELVNYFKISNN